MNAPRDALDRALARWYFLALLIPVDETWESNLSLALDRGLADLEAASP